MNEHTLHAIHRPSGLSLSFVVLTRRSAGQASTVRGAISVCAENGAAPEDAAALVMYLGTTEMLEKIRPNPNFGVIFRPEALLEVHLIRSGDKISLGQLLPADSCAAAN